MLSRRDFLHRFFLYTLSLYAGGSALSACSPRETPPPIIPTSTMPPSPTATNTLSPTGVPYGTRAPTAAATTTLTRVPPSPTPFQPYLSVAHGPSPSAITRAAIDTLGGIGRFVKKGDDVIIKPNICNASLKPELASTTNPEVVATLVTLCLDAGAKRVRVMDQPFSGTAVEAYKTSGIRDAVERAGGQMEIMSDMKYVTTSFPQGRDIKSWKVYEDILKADVLINVPVAKTHDLAKLTLAMKGLMGVIPNANRSAFHNSIDQRIADLNTVVHPTLNVVDAVRVVVRNGPTNWNPANVVLANTVIASHDVVAADAYAAKTLFQRQPQEIGYIRLGGEMGIGKYDLQNMVIKEVSV